MFLSFLSEVFVVVLATIKTIATAFAAMMDTVIGKMGEALLSYLKTRLA